MIGTRLGSYELLEEVGRGGMAAVYRAYQPSVDRFVAIKVIEKNLADDPLGVDRFQREARLIARLEHVHILPVYDFDGGNQPPYIVMRYLEGGTLRDILKRGQLPLSDIAYLFKQIASALDYSHRQGIIHRDIKPSNVMIDREGNAFVSDFGIARMMTRPENGSNTETGVAVGTPDYMAPEQVMGNANIDHRADVYALGVMLYQMLTGQLPFASESAFGLMMKHLSEAIPSAAERNPALSVEVDAIIQRAMAKDVDARYASVAALAAEVSALAGGTNSNAQIRWAAGETSRMSLKLREANRERVEQTVADLKKQRTGMDTPSTPTEHNKLVTALSLDVGEYATLLGEVGDAEAARSTISAFLHTVRDLVSRRGGKVSSQADNTLLALWGSDASHEDDAENAIHAALALQTALQAATADLLESGEPLPFKIGIHTGIALLTPVEKTGEFTASGVTINLANKLSDAADGVILITHDTFRAVQGVFDLQNDVPLKVRGRKEPLPTYRVLVAKARAFRLDSRGVYGVETAMIGRKGDLEQLQDAFEEAIEESETHVFTVIGAPGMGKSRLLYEFARWAELHPAQFRIFRGRATSNMTQRPYALLRDVLSFRFDILDSDPLPVVRHKLEVGVTDLTGSADNDMAHLIGHLIGFDLSDSEAVKGLLSDPAQLATRGRILLKKLIAQTAKSLPVVFQLEDIHLADEPSLTWLQDFTAESPDLPLFVIYLARPDLLERVPEWGAKSKVHKRLTLEPLSKRESRALVGEVLKRLPEVPAKLRDALVEQAEGNPFFIEETIKMLIEDRVIVVEGATWRVEESRLEHWRVPPTLFALLQARLDTLLYPEKLTLQRASVVGRIFYDTALATLDKADDNHLDDLPGTLKTLVERDFIYPRPNSSFEGAAEYIFAQNLLREAIYSTLLKRQLKAYHLGMADWLVGVAGERLDEYLSLIAEHYEKGGEPLKAATYLHRAGERSLNKTALRDARQAFEKVLALLPEANAQERLPVQLRLGATLFPMGEYEAARAILKAALETAQTLHDTEAQAEILNQLGEISTSLGQYAEALAYLERAYPLAQASSQRTLGTVLHGLATLHFRSGNLELSRQFGTEGLAAARALGDAVLEARLLNRLGTSYGFDDPARSVALFQEGLSLARHIGHRELEAASLDNLGVSAVLNDDLQGSIPYCRAALEISRETGNLNGMLNNMFNLAEIYVLLNDISSALPYLAQTIQLARRLGHPRHVINAVELLGSVKYKQGDVETALKYNGVAWFHPTLSSEGRAQMERRLAEWRAELGLSEAAMNAKLEAGRNLDVDAVLDAFLREQDGGT
jgi:serine/threonine protein kinase/tetratricopeptide (TPR) repeat protein